MRDSRLATAKASRRKTAGNRRNLALWAGAVVLAAVVVWLLFGASAMGYARAGTAYGARIACSCRFVAGRTLKDCAKDKIAGMELIHLSEDDEAKSVTATFPLLASDTASYRKGYGCLLKPWED
jgi:hypothetical protein